MNFESKQSLYNQNGSYNFYSKVKIAEANLTINFKDGKKVDIND